MTERIVICGAGIAGVSAAYHLAVLQGHRNVVLVEEGNPLSLTSDKSTEAYRNWWPGPDRAMTAYMNRTIDILERIARDTGNRINMNRRGYLFASADSAKADWLLDAARKAESHGAGPVRLHDTASASYAPAAIEGFESPLVGADIITSRTLIEQHFPYLSRTTKVVAHARRAGWLSAQQLGMVMLEAARGSGVELVRGRVAGIDAPNGQLRTVHVDRGAESTKLEASHLVLAAGPPLLSLSKTLGLDLPIFAERHFKISLSDTLGIVPRHAPMIIWLDEQRLPWSDEERAMLAADPGTRWLTEPFPGGVHGRPDGRGASTTLLMLFNYKNEPAEVIYPLPESEHYGEITLRGMSTMVPALAAYVEKGVRPYIDGGYYLKTRENRPLIGPTAIGGVYLCSAFSGFGIMASCAGGELLAAHVLGRPLPDYAPAFMLSRYQDPAYRAMLDNWGDGSQL